MNMAATQYGPCRKNQNFSFPSPVYDGCLQYQSCDGSFKCEACGCHRNFHERLKNCAEQYGGHLPVHCQSCLGKREYLGHEEDDDTMSYSEERNAGKCVESRGLKTCSVFNGCLLTQCTMCMELAREPSSVHVPGCTFNSNNTMNSPKAPQEMRISANTKSCCPGAKFLDLMKNQCVCHGSLQARMGSITEHYGPHGEMHSNVSAELGQEQSQEMRFKCIRGHKDVDDCVKTEIAEKSVLRPEECQEARMDLNMNFGGSHGHDSVRSESGNSSPCRSSECRELMLINVSSRESHSQLHDCVRNGYTSVKKENEMDTDKETMRSSAGLDDGECRVLSLEESRKDFLQRMSSAAVIRRVKFAFAVLQRQHSESCLSLSFDKEWKIYCGVCSKYLAADKSGIAFHNAKQHFRTRVHRLNLELSRVRGPSCWRRGQCGGVEGV